MEVSRRISVAIFGVVFWMLWWVDVVWEVMVKGLKWDVKVESENGSSMLVECGKVGLVAKPRPWVRLLNQAVLKSLCVKS